MENLELDNKKRKLRSINETLKSIKNEDPETAITRYMITMETSKGVHLPSVERFLELTKAIYKLDSETGNYIKVWKKG